ncbi:hypothetical protein, partial [Novipirellula maiorica]|uniref:hypothetical protein n=1 Tax=Novipirellula maiorica TaxID=1265734 RepID=UPI00059280F9
MLNRVRNIIHQAFGNEAGYHCLGLSSTSDGEPTRASEYASLAVVKLKISAAYRGRVPFLQSVVARSGNLMVVGCGRSSLRRGIRTTKDTNHTKST